MNWKPVHYVILHIQWSAIVRATLFGALGIAYLAAILEGIHARVTRN